MFPADLPEDVLEELSDPRFSHRKHYSRSTYALKCHGPLCRKAERDRGRGRWFDKQAAKGIEVQPRPGARFLEDDARLEPIIKWYLDERKKKKVK